MSNNNSTKAKWFKYVEEGNKDGIKQLLEEGIDIDIQDGIGRTALIMASGERGHTDIVKFLVEKGASLDIQNGDDDTALMTASGYGYTEIVKILVEKGASLDILDVVGWTALTRASSEGHTEIVKLLVKKGASLDIQSKEGNTALILASKKRHTEIVKILVEKGANVDLQDKSGITALILASKKGAADIVKILVEKGANLDIQDKNGKTALIIASIEGHTDVVKILVEKGADINIKDKKGKTALDYTKNDKIRKILSRDPLTLWKGFTRSDIEKFDSIFEEKAENYSLCPICFKYIERSEACMYMSHNCTSSGGYYHKELYNKYKNDEGIIYWCTICSRICSGHRHYELVNDKAKKPDLLTGSGGPFVKDCSVSSGGGGPLEKLARFRRLREYALDLQEDVDKKEKDDALDELVEEVWNAPLARSKKVGKIAESKKWNISSDEFPKNAATEENKTNAPNVPFDGKLPTEVESGRNNVMMNDDIPVLRFHHKQKAGSEESHGISKETLEGFITDKNKNFGDESFGFCFMYPGACDSRLHPKELEGHIPEDLYEEYRKKFNKKFRGQGGGSEQNVFQEATDAVCSVVKKRRGGSRKRRTVRRKTRRMATK